MPSFEVSGRLRTTTLIFGGSATLESSINFDCTVNEINFDLAKELGVKETPSYVINGNFAPGLIPTEKFKSIIVQLRASAEEAPPSVEKQQEETVPSAEDKSNNEQEAQSVTDK